MKYDSQSGVFSLNAPRMRGLSALPERQRLVVFLRYYAGLDYRSIASALDVEVGTVSASLASAHAAIRKAVKEEEVHG